MVPASQESVRLIVGLGNPGASYEATRHNAGFWLADRWAADMGTAFALKGTAWVAKAHVSGDAVFLAKPVTFMNKSGQAVGALARFYRLSPAQILVLHDELDLLPGQIKLKQGGGHAGHNGLRDIQAALGSAGFWRLRIGIGHPRTLGLAQPVLAFVLHPPRREELSAIETAMARACVILPAVLAGDFARATAQLHEGNRAVSG